jgi:hypothetical protein
MECQTDYGNGFFGKKLKRLQRSRKDFRRVAVQSLLYIRANKLNVLHRCLGKEAALVRGNG